MDLLATGRELAAIAQTGGHFTKDKYDQERYQRIGEIAADILASCSDVPSDTVYSWAKEEFGYATPKVDVRAVVVDADRLLLAREDADEGRWTVPGGWADVNESPSESLVREVKEETGYEVRPLCLLAVFDRERQGHSPPFPFHVYKMFFHCQITGGAARKTSECSESAFFTEDSLPELSLSRILPSQIHGFLHAIRTGKTMARYD